MQATGRRYASYVNQRHKRSSTFSEERFKASVLNAEEYLL